MCFCVTTFCRLVPEMLKLEAEKERGREKEKKERSGVEQLRGAL